MFLIRGRLHLWNFFLVRLRYMGREEQDKNLGVWCIIINLAVCITYVIVLGRRSWVNKCKLFRIRMDPNFQNEIQTNSIRKQLVNVTTPIPLPGGSSNLITE
jgi:hypothetical protein